MRNKSKYKKYIMEVLSKNFIIPTIFILGVSNKHILLYLTLIPIFEVIAFYYISIKEEKLKSLSGRLYCFFILSFIASFIMLQFAVLSFNNYDYFVELCLITHYVFNLFFVTTEMSLDNYKKSDKEFNFNSFYLIRNSLLLTTLVSIVILLIF